MSKHKLLKGFSKLSRDEKINQLLTHLNGSKTLETNLKSYLHVSNQALFDDISENTVSNYYLPFSLAPNFLINNKLHILPMVIEESSVVAAASKAASFWALNGGFKTQVINTFKNGQLFFTWIGDLNKLINQQVELEALLRKSCADITQNMVKRGGGIKSFTLSTVDNMPTTHQLLVTFETADSMGANFINTCLEQMTPVLIDYINSREALTQKGKANSVMAILSNYTPDCLVECSVECPIVALAPYAGVYTPQVFANRFATAVNIAINNTHRAVTHNKGIFNGIDALVLATGNDFRAIEAGAQAYAARDGQYRSLTSISLVNNTFKYTLQVPLALGTVGGLTNSHPLAKAALEILQNPTANELMQIVAAAGMANNFSAVASLVTTGIQKGHMKLHLSNILTSLNASETEKTLAVNHFSDKMVSFSTVQAFVNTLRVV